MDGGQRQTQDDASRKRKHKTQAARTNADGDNSAANEDLASAGRAPRDHMAGWLARRRSRVRRGLRRASGTAQERLERKRGVTGGGPAWISRASAAGAVPWPGCAEFGTGGVRQPPSYTYHPFFPPSAPPHCHPYDAYHARYGSFPAVAPSPLGYAPHAPPCYPPTAAYCQATPTAPVLTQTPQTLLDAYPEPVQPHSDGALPSRKRTRVNFSESGRSDRSSSPPIEILTTVLQDVGMGQQDRKGCPCSLAVGSLISALRCAGPALDMDVTSKGVDNCSSGCGNAERVGEGLCAASRMLMGGSPLDAVVRYAASMESTNCC